MADPRITNDRNDIETWADQHDAVPVREGDQTRLVPESEITGDHERLDWDEFHREVDEQNRAVTYHGETEGREPFEVHDREDAIERVTSEADLDREEAEQRLVEGETITGKITETTVVEETIVETATVESEVVDRETVEQNVVDVELLDRECRSCDVSAEGADTDYVGTYGSDRFLTDTVETGSDEQYDDYPFDVTVELREDWGVTIEQRDRYTVESRIMDVDATETDQVEGRDIEADIDLDAVHQQLLTSDDLDVHMDAREDEMRDTETYEIESEFTGDDVLTTNLTSRRRFRREISDRSRLTTQVVESELLDREMVSEEDLETGLVKRDATETDTEVERETMETDTEVERETVETDTEVERETTVTDTEVETGDAVRSTLDQTDEGKTVVNASGDEIGEIIDVDDGVAYVDAHPSLTERVMAKLGADENDDAYRLRDDKIDRVTDDEVVVTTGVVDDEFDETNR
jgi:hypothetical protein